MVILFCFIHCDCDVTHDENKTQTRSFYLLKLSRATESLKYIVSAFRQQQLQLSNDLCCIFL